jgi:hypothetical protein
LSDLLGRAEQARAGGCEVMEAALLRRCTAVADHTESAKAGEGDRPKAGRLHAQGAQLGVRKGSRSEATRRYCPGEPLAASRVEERRLCCQARPNVRVNADRVGRRCKPGNRKCTPYLLPGLRRLP